MVVPDKTMEKILSPAAETSHLTDNTLHEFERLLDLCDEDLELTLQEVRDEGLFNFSHKYEWIIVSTFDLVWKSWPCFNVPVPSDYNLVVLKHELAFTWQAAYTGNTKFTCMPLWKTYAKFCLAYEPIQLPQRLFDFLNNSQLAHSKPHNILWAMWLL